MLTAPANQGAVYTVAPVHNLHQARTVHRDMLKAVLGPESLAAPPRAHSPCRSEQVEADSLSDGDLWLLVPETPLPPLGPSSSSAKTRSEVQASSSALPTSRGIVPSVYSLSPSEQPGTSQQVPRRTARTATGHHSNPHHLPLPAGQHGNPSQPVSNAQVAVFKPWC